MYKQNIFTKLLAFLSYGLFLIVGVPSADAQTAQQIAKKAFDSTVLLVMEDANGQPMFLGSGFLVRNGEIASNLHVVEGAWRGYAKFVGQKTKYDLEGITGIDTDRDLVLLKITAAPTPLMPLGNSDTVEVGEPIYAVGNPQGLEGTFFPRNSSSIRQVGPHKLLQITAPISPGSSGGPVLNSKGEVIGVSVATFRGGQNLNFAIPSNYLKALLTKAGPARPLKGDKPTTQQSIMANIGGRSTEGVIGGQFFWGMHGEYTFSLHNQLRQNIKNVSCLVIFYDSKEVPIEFDLVQFSAMIPAGLSKRLKSKVDQSVRDITGAGPGSPPKTRVDFRILDFQLVE